MINEGIIIDLIEKLSQEAIQEIKLNQASEKFYKINSQIEMILELAINSEYSSDSIYDSYTNHKIRIQSELYPSKQQLTAY